MNDDYKRIYGGCAETPLVKALVDIVTRHGPDTSASLSCVLTSVGGGLANVSVSEMLRLGLHSELLHDAKNIMGALEEEYISAMFTSVPITLRVARHAHGNVVLGNSLYVIGGRGDRPLSTIERADLL